MKRYFVLVASVCALLLALAAGPAFAGTPQPPNPVQPTGGNQGQSNTAILSNIPVLSGNSVAVINTGDQNSSANTNLSQVNQGQPVGKEGGSYGDGQPTQQPTTDLAPNGPSGGDGSDSSQSNTAVLSNIPVASGNSVAVINGGQKGCGCDGNDGGGQTSSADTNLSQVNQSSGNGGSNDGGQSNTAVLSNIPVASGNSVAVVNTGDQTSSADTNLSQANQSSGHDQPGWDGKSCRCQGGKKDGKSDGGGQSNTAVLSNIPVASGNSVAVINTGDQTSSANTNLSQVNQSSGNGGSDGDGQSNTAVLSNIPIASGNSVAVINTGNQSSSANTNLSQVNQSSGQDQSGWDGNKGRKSDDGGQSNTAVLSNIPVASGNSVALVNTGDQTSSGNTNLSQVNQRSGQDKRGSKWGEPKPAPSPSRSRAPSPSRSRAPSPSRSRARSPSRSRATSRSHRARRSRASLSPAT